MIKAILVVDADGKRIMARYYGAPEFPTGEAETTFEKKLYDKTMRTNAKNEGALARLESPLAPALSHRSEAQGCGRAPLAALACPPRPPRPRSACVLAAEVIMFDNIVTVYRNSADVWFYVTPRRLKSAKVAAPQLATPASSGGERRVWPAPPTLSSGRRAAGRSERPRRGRRLRRRPHRSRLFRRPDEPLGPGLLRRWPARGRATPNPEPNLEPKSSPGGGEPARERADPRARAHGAAGGAQHPA